MLRSEILNSIPQRKIIEALEQTVRNCSVCSSKKDIKLDHGLCTNCMIANEAINRYAIANIPVKYWSLEMELHFKGDTILLEKYREIVGDLRQTYRAGLAICFAGTHGVGKTLSSCNILKRAVEKSYTALYTNLQDIVNVMLSRESEDKLLARRELLMVDFLVIDEFDPRYMSNDKASDLFGKILEEIFRTRAQNNLPILMCTNSPNVIESFSGSIKQSIESLMAMVTTIPVLGQDFRKTSK